MWVLEARKDAEKVWFPVVWEEEKDASNVIDYDIHEEITIDTSSVFNANNDTTTGMATVIPWVNAPKLKMSTSIYKDVDEPVWWATMNWSTAESMIYPSDPSSPIRNWTISNEWGDAWFEQINSTDVLKRWFAPKISWWYKLVMTFPHWWSTYSIDVQLRNATTRETLYSYVWQFDTQTRTATINIYLKAWEPLYCWCTLKYIGSSPPFSTWTSMNIVATKL